MCAQSRGFGFYRFLNRDLLTHRPIWLRVNPLTAEEEKEEARPVDCVVEEPRTAEASSSLGKMGFGGARRDGSGAVVPRQSERDTKV